MLKYIWCLQRSRALGCICASRPCHTGPTLDKDWTELAKKQLKGRDPAQTLLWHTPEGITIKPLYTANDAEG